MSESSGRQVREEHPPPDSEPADDAERDEDRRERWMGLLREVALSILIVLFVGAMLFAISGVWPPLVAVESDSMEPQIMTGDLVFIVEPDRFAGAAAVDGTGVVPSDRAAEHGHTAFDEYGDVIIFAPNGERESTPIIHRAHLWVEEGENWHDRADASLTGGASDCEQLANCPAPHAGFITHGDNNAFYDQAQDSSSPVKGDWIIARARLRVPWLGHIRLLLTGVLAVIAPVGIQAALQIEP